MSKRISLIILIIASGLAYLGLGQQADAMDSDVEQTILASTLRIEINTWMMYVEGQGYVSYSGDGHGTVIDGRHLVTHNHYQVPLLDLMADNKNSELATVTLYKADSQQLWEGPLTAMEVAYEGSETLLFEFQDEDGRGLFERLGVPPANLDVISVQVGTEVAQINWDNSRAYVQWTSVEAITKEGETPVIRLSGCLVPGSSGGGIFVDGVHIANNWSKVDGCDGSPNGDMPFQSTGALNSVELVAEAR
jgi:hypothetical protein